MSAVVHNRRRQSSTVAGMWRSQANAQQTGRCGAAAALLALATRANTPRRVTATTLARVGHPTPAGATRHDPQGRREKAAAWYLLRLPAARTRTYAACLAIGPASCVAHERLVRLQGASHGAARTFRPRGSSFLRAALDQLELEGSDVARNVRPRPTRRRSWPSRSKAAQRPPGTATTRSLRPVVLSLRHTAVAATSSSKPASQEARMGALEQLTT